MAIVHLKQPVPGLPGAQMTGGVFSKAATKAALLGAAAFWPWGDEQLLPVSLNDIAGAASADFNFSVHPQMSALLLALVINQAPGAGELTGSPVLNWLKGPKRRLFSEITSTAASIAVAESQDLQFQNHRDDWNLLWEHEGYAWARLWPGEGPDYLFIEPVNIDAYFMEVKGVSSIDEFFRVPSKFIEEKLQSLNATVPGLAITAHFLSYSYLDGGWPMAIKWFNNRNVIGPSGNDPRFLLRAALTQFFRTLANAGHEELALHLVPRLGEPAAFARVLESSFRIEGDLWVERSRRNLRLALRRPAIDVMRQLSRGVERLEPKEVAGAVRQIRSLRFEGEAPDGFSVTYRSPVGVVLITERPTLT